MPPVTSRLCVGGQTAFSQQARCKDQGANAMDSIVDTLRHVRTEDEGPVPTPGGALAIQIRLMAVAATARFQGAELDVADLRRASDTAPSPAALAEWVGAAGLWSKPAHLSWPQLVSLQVSRPVPLLLNDGSAVLLVATDKKRDLVFVRHSRLPSDAPSVALRQSELAKVWSGEAVLIRAKRGAAREEIPFSFGWVAQLVWQERHAMRDVLLASLALSILTVLPPLIVMTVIDQVVVHQSLSTLVLVSLLIGTAMLSETLLGYARRQLIQIVGARVDAKLNLHVFHRLLRLPLDYFERNQAGFEVAPVSWTPEYLGSRSPRWPRQEEPIHLSFVARWLSWCMVVARPRNWRMSSNRRRSRSGIGWCSGNATPVAATVA
jgi:hypothetical protein